MTSDVLSTMTDEEIMARIAQGEMALLGPLYTKYDAMVKRALRRFAARLSKERIDELSQDVFIALAESAPRFPGHVKLKTWLYSIAAKTAQNARQSSSLHVDILYRNRELAPGIAVKRNQSPAHHTEIRDSLFKALAQLPESQRDVLILHTVDGFNGEEIARILGIKPKTVWTRLHRARQTIQRNL